MNSVHLIDLFDLSGLPCKETIKALSEEVRGYGFVVESIHPSDTSILVRFRMPLLESIDNCSLSGTLKIDRIRKKFHINAGMKLDERADREYESVGIVESHGHLNSLDSGLGELAFMGRRTWLTEAKNRYPALDLMQIFNRMSTGARKSFHNIVGKYAASGAYVLGLSELSELGNTLDEVEAMLDEIATSGFARRTSEGYRFNKAKLDSLIELGVLKVRGNYTLR